MATYYEDWKLESFDGANIFGTRDFANEEGNAKNCIVIVHGFKGDKDRYLPKRSAELFLDKGYDCVRFNLYSGDERRQLKNCVIEKHASDIKSVIDEFNAEYDNIYLVGISLSGLSAALLNSEDITAQSYWDPVFYPDSIYDPRLFEPLTDEYEVFSKGAHAFVINKNSLEAYRKFTVETSKQLARDLVKPVQVVTAENGGALVNSETYTNYANTQNEHVVISGADHSFHQGNAIYELVDVVEKWFNKF